MPSKDERDERVSIPLDPQEALRGLLRVDPAEVDGESEESDQSGDAEEQDS